MWTAGQNSSAPAAAMQIMKHKPYGITCEIQKKRVECAMMIQAYNKLKAPKVMHQPGTKAARKAEGLSAT